MGSRHSEALFPRADRPDDLGKAVGGIGNYPTRQIALLALSTFAEQPASRTDLNQRIHTLATGREIDEIDHDLPKVVSQHSYKRIFQPAGLIELRRIPHPTGRQQYALGARLTRKGGSLGIAMCGMLLPIALGDPEGGFLTKTLGSSTYIKSINPRLPMYRRLLEGPARPYELIRESQASRSHVDMVVQELTAYGILQKARRFESAIAITEAFRPRIGAMIEGMDLLASNSEQADDFRNKAYQNVETILRSPDLVSRIMSQDQNLVASKPDTWLPVARELIAEFGAVPFPELYQQVVSVTGGYIRYGVFVKLLMDSHKQAASVDTLKRQPHIKSRVNQHQQVKPHARPVIPKHSVVKPSRTARPQNSQGSFTSPDLRFPRDWEYDAVCRQLDPELFFPVGQGRRTSLQAERAKRICRQCPVWPACLKKAVDTGSEYGVSAGVWLSAGELTPEKEALAAKVEIV